MATNDEATRPDGVTSTSDLLEPRLMALVEQLGRIAGTVHAKAEGWLDREALAKQIASVRDGAAELLEHFTAAATKAATTAPAAAAPRGNTKGRSGGVVDAPGKKHRKPLPANPGANKAASQTARMRAAKTMVKTNRRRGRG